MSFFFIDVKNLTIVVLAWKKEIARLQYVRFSRALFMSEYKITGIKNYAYH